MIADMSADPRLESYTLEYLLESPSSLLVGRLLTSDYLMHSKDALRRRYELLSYTQILLHAMLFPSPSQATAAGQKKSVSMGEDEDEDEDEDEEEEGRSGEDLYYHSLEIKLRAEKAAEKSKTADMYGEEDETVAPAVSFLRNTILLLKA